MYLCFFIISFKIYGNSPSDYPQTSFYYHKTLNYSVDAKIVLKEKDKETEVVTKKNLETTTKVKGGYGAGFDIEIPHNKWMNFGFSLGYRLNTSPDEGFDPRIIGFKFNTLTRLFTRLKYPLSFDPLYLIPFLRLGLGVSGGFLAISPYLETDNRQDNNGITLVLTSFPLEMQLGVDIFTWRWFGITISYLYSWEFGRDFFVSRNPEFKNKIDGHPTIKASETALVINFKTTYF